MINPGPQGPCQAPETTAQHGGNKISQVGSGRQELLRQAGPFAGFSMKLRELPEQADDSHTFPRHEGNPVIRKGKRLSVQC